MKIKELKGLQDADLHAKLSELKMELIRQYGQIAKGTIPKSPALVRNTKKTVARIHTLLHQRKKGKEEKTTP
ncbi:50S ribosomal protein L29 [Candidatus Woesearchaeota archaeon]|nr:50S ribosomal protein L29 [Candidatus Woesearchaeota archaeon]